MRHVISRTSQPPPFLKRLLLLAVLVGSLISLPRAAAAAPLVWEKTERSVAATPGQEIATVVYAFRNSSDHPVRITSIDTGCVCTSAELPKDNYAPGEKGELTVKFTLGDRVGRQERLIQVAIDGSTSPSASLKLVVDIPELAVIRPRLLFWEVGRALESQSAEIVLAEPQYSQISDPQSNNPAFTAKLTAGARAGVYRLVITPSSTAEADHGVVHIPVSFHGKPQMLSIFVAVK